MLFFRRYYLILSASLRTGDIFRLKQFSVLSGKILLSRSSFIRRDKFSRLYLVDCVRRFGFLPVLPRLVKALSVSSKRVHGGSS